MYVCMYVLVCANVCMYVCMCMICDAHHGVVLPVPVYSGLGHEHGDVLLQLVVVELQRLLDEVVLAGQPSILIINVCMYECMYTCIII